MKSIIAVVLSILCSSVFADSDNQERFELVINHGPDKYVTKFRTVALPHTFEDWKSEVYTHDSDGTEREVWDGVKLIVSRANSGQIHLDVVVQKIVAWSQSGPLLIPQVKTMNYKGPVPAPAAKNDTYKAVYVGSGFDAAIRRIDYN